MLYASPVRSSKIALAAFVWTSIVTAIPYALVYIWREDIEPPIENAQGVGQQWWFLTFMKITLVVGVILCLILAVQIPLNTMAAIKRNKDGKLCRWMVAGNIMSSAQIKMAGSRKVNSFLSNAHALHPLGAGAGKTVWIGGKKQSRSERAMR